MFKRGRGSSDICACSEFKPLNCKGCFGGLGGSKVAQVSIFCTGGVGFFDTIGFTGIMDRFVRRLALAGVLQHEQAADCS